MERLKAKEETEPLIEVSLFSWLGNMIVLKPALVSDPSLFLWVIKTNKHGIKLRHGREDRTEEDRQDLNIFSAAKLTR